VALRHLRFIPGTEEILIIDDAAQARVFSLISQQFRCVQCQLYYLDTILTGWSSCSPATLRLPSIPVAVHCTPDGACFLVSCEPLGGSPATIAYHWGTFGSSNGIVLDAVDVPLRDAVVSYFVNRASVHVFVLDLTSRTICSLALDITQKATEFSFMQKGVKNSSKGGSVSSHNSLIDCHADVWTRFPVIPAVRRGTFSNKSKRCQKSLTFVVDRDHREYARYYTDMAQDFMRKTGKPAAEELNNVRVCAVEYEHFLGDTRSGNWGAISAYRAGEWFADLFCLIPIHIAVCRENRFVPLADGVLSPELERSLLGADVSRIVDSLSFGWYESLFQSYFANKVCLVPQARSMTSHHIYSP
jgi:hypothetical protein